MWVDNYFCFEASRGVATRITYSTRDKDQNNIKYIRKFKYKLKVSNFKYFGVFP